MICNRCVFELLQDAEMTSEESALKAVQDAVDGARTAVTVVDGDALCVPHLMRRVTAPPLLHLPAGGAHRGGRKLK